MYVFNLQLTNSITSKNNRMNPFVFDPVFADIYRIVVKFHEVLEPLA